MLSLRANVQVWLEYSMCEWAGNMKEGWKGMEDINIYLKSCHVEESLALLCQISEHKTKRIKGKYKFKLILNKNFLTIRANDSNDQQYLYVEWPALAGCASFFIEGL